MISFLNFLSKNKTVLLFIILVIIAFIFIFNTNLFQGSILEKKIVTINGNVNNKITSVTDYFNLKKVNLKLAEENTELKNKHEGRFLEEKTIVKKDSTYRQIFYYIPAHVVSNSIDRQNNYIIINKGSNHGIESDMGIVSSNGIMGQIVTTTENYSKVMSILNVNSMINARLKNTKYFGILKWEREDSRTMHLDDIPKYVKIKRGDTIETDGKSTLYPEGISLGTVIHAEIDDETGNWDIKVGLFQDMGNIQEVYVVNRMDKAELKKLNDTISKN